jgi:hypothetical protein
MKRTATFDFKEKQILKAVDDRRLDALCKLVSRIQCLLFIILGLISMKSLKVKLMVRNKKMLNNLIFMAQLFMKIYFFKIS